MPPPLLVIWMFHERDLLAVELLMIQTSMILESCDVNQPLEVANEFCADEELVCAVDFSWKISLSVRVGLGTR